MGQKVEAEINFVDLPSILGSTQPGVTATCGRCEHTTESAGTGGASVRRCLALLREECPKGERNFYEGDSGDE